MFRWFMAAGACSALLAVAIGAFGAHVLEDRIAVDRIDVYETGAHYHLIHSVGLLVIGLTSRIFPRSRMLRWSGILMVAGIVLFSGSLYTLSLSGIGMWGAIAPLGGTSFLISWALLGITVWKNYPKVDASKKKEFADS